MGISADDWVVVSGLESESGKSLNGKLGQVTRYDASKGRYEVRFGEDRLVCLRPENLSCAGAGAGELGAGDEIEVFGLESEQGRELNGQRGTVVRRAQGAQSERWEVRFGGLGKGEVRLVNLKPSNLRRVHAQGGDCRGSSSSWQKAGEAPSSGSASRGQPASGRSGTSGGRAGGGLKACQGDATIRPGDLVEVSGLTSAAGQALNGEEASVIDVDEDRGRAEVRFDALGGKVQSLKLQSLRKLDLMIGDLVEVVGLESSKGERLNGDKGSLKRFVEDTGRWEVLFIPHRLMSLKADNLQRVDTAVFEGRA